MFQNIFNFLIAWYNLPYTVFMALGVIIAALQLFGLSHDGDADADMDADADVDLDADVDADIDLDHDLDMDHDLDHDIDHDVDHDVDGGASSGLAWLAFIGVGKAPLMVVLLIMLFSTGLLGWLLNSIILGSFGILSGLLVVVSWLVSLSVGIFITSRVTRTIGRVLPPISSTATKAHAMVGMNGTVTSPFVDAKYGMIHLRDPGGTLVSLFAVTEDEKPIPRGSSVILVSYDTVQKRYLVTRR